MCVWAVLAVRTRDVADVMVHLHICFDACASCNGDKPSSSSAWVRGAPVLTGASGRCVCSVTTWVRAVHLRGLRCRRQLWRNGTNHGHWGKADKARVFLLPSAHTLSGSWSFPLTRPWSARASRFQTEHGSSYVIGAVPVGGRCPWRSPKDVVTLATSTMEKSCSRGPGSLDLIPTTLWDREALMRSADWTFSQIVTCARPNWSWRDSELFSGASTKHFYRQTVSRFQYLRTVNRSQQSKSITEHMTVWIVVPVQ